MAEHGQMSIDSKHNRRQAAQQMSRDYLVYVHTRHPLTGDDSLARQLVNDVWHVEVFSQVRVAADELFEALLAPCLVLVVTLH